jgi:SAM-dependent methyltransferase
MNGTMKDVYIKGEYLSRHPTWHEEDSPWKAKQILTMLKKHNLRPKTICEIGCGAGEILTELYCELPDYVSFTGYEISPHAYELSKGKMKERLQFYLRDFLQETDCYDVLLVIDVVEHVEDYYNFLRILRKRGNYKIFHIPLDISVQKILLNTPIHRRKSFGHIQYFMKETAVATLEDTGYEIVDLFYTSIFLDTPAKSPIYLLGKLGLRISTSVLRTILNEDLAVRLLGGHSLMVLAK